MSIKQNGGIFGRNPTFNDVTIEGQLTFDGDIDVGSDLKVDGDVDVTGRLSVGATHSFLGVYAEKDNGSGYVAGFRKDNASPYLTIQTTGSRTQLQGINSGFTDVAPIGLQPSGGDINVGAGNFVMTSGYGIDFSATSGTGTSELFDDYEEGTWTPTIAAGSGTFATVSAAGRYTKTGRMVIAQLRIFLTDSTGGSGWINISNFPFANSQASYAVAYGESPSGQMIRGTIGASSVNIFEYDNTDPVTNGNYSVTLIYEAT
jgi:hypothetical protein